MPLLRMIKHVKILELVVRQKEWDVLMNPNHVLNIRVLRRYVKILLEVQIPKSVGIQVQVLQKIHFVWIENVLMILNQLQLMHVNYF